MIVLDEFANIDKKHSGTVRDILRTVASVVEEAGGTTIGMDDVPEELDGGISDSALSRGETG